MIVLYYVVLHQVWICFHLVFYFYTSYEREIELIDKLLYSLIGWIKQPERLMLILIRRN